MTGLSPHWGRVGAGTFSMIKAYPWILVQVSAEGLKHFGKAQLRVVNHTWVLPAVVHWVVVEGRTLRESWECFWHKTLVVTETLWQNLLKSGKSHLGITCWVVDPGKMINCWLINYLRTLQAQNIFSVVVNMPLVCNCLGISSKLFMLSDGWQESASKLWRSRGMVSC